MCHTLLVLFALTVTPIWLAKIWADVSPFSGYRRPSPMSRPIYIPTFRPEPPRVPSQTEKSMFRLWDVLMIVLALVGIAILFH